MEVSVNADLSHDECNEAVIIKSDVNRMSKTPFYFHKKTRLGMLASNITLVDDLVKLLISKGVTTDTTIDFLTDKAPTKTGDNVFPINNKSHHRAYHSFVAIEFFYRDKLIRAISGSNFDRYGIMKCGEWTYFRNLAAAIK